MVLRGVKIINQLAIEGAVYGLESDEKDFSQKIYSILKYLELTFCIIIYLAS